MNTTAGAALFACNGAQLPAGQVGKTLEYRLDHDNRNMTVSLPSLIQSVQHLPDRILDLLEIAAYIFSADRLTSRGRRDAVEFHTWSRRIEFYIRVRDTKFWNLPEVKKALSDALVFLTGDASYKFNFIGGHSTPRTSLFDRDGLSVDVTKLKPAIMLFSGGLDSLAGALKLLEENNHVFLVSHQSQPSTTKTQRQLQRALASRYPGKVFHYKFECHLHQYKATEESQRTRSFLYSSIALAVAVANGVDDAYIFENGVTSINLYRREDLANARASRTTHPKSILLLERLFSLVVEGRFSLHLPFIDLTKKEVMELLRDSSAPELISSAVSCGHTRKLMDKVTHCGQCFQCIDRRCAAYAAGVADRDHSGIYANDIITSAIDDREARTAVIDYIRQAASFARWNPDRFMEEYLSELADVIEGMRGPNGDSERVEAIAQLMSRHGHQVSEGLQAMRNEHDHPFRSLPEGSLLSLISHREYLKPEKMRLADRVGKLLFNAIPEMFRNDKPKNETDLNRKVHVLLKSHYEALRSEYPKTAFACAKVIPDHEIEGTDLLIEAKYIRQGTPPSKASEGIAADLTKYPQESFVLFLVYDPARAIPSDMEFRRDFERGGRCRVLTLR